MQLQHALTQPFLLVTPIPLSNIATLTSLPPSLAPASEVFSAYALFSQFSELRISVCKFLNSLIMHAENKYTAWCAQNSVRIQSVESDSANGSIYCINKQYFYFARSLVTCIALTLGNAPK